MEKGEAGAVYQRTGARASMHAKALAGQIAAAFVGTHAGRASLAVIDHDDDDSAAVAVAVTAAADELDPPGKHW